MKPEHTHNRSTTAAGELKEHAARGGRCTSLTKLEEQPASSRSGRQAQEAYAGRGELRGERMKLDEQPASSGSGRQAQEAYAGRGELCGDAGVAACPAVLRPMRTLARGAAVVRAVARLAHAEVLREVRPPLAVRTTRR